MHTKVNLRLWPDQTFWTLKSSKLSPVGKWFFHADPPISRACKGWVERGSPERRGFENWVGQSSCSPSNALVHSLRYVISSQAYNRLCKLYASWELQTSKRLPGLETILMLDNMLTLCNHSISIYLLPMVPGKILYSLLQALLKHSLYFGTIVWHTRLRLCSYQTLSYEDA